MRSFITLMICLLTSNVYASGLDLTLVYGSRQVGLGGQQIAISTDAYAPFYNPAAMMGVENVAVAVGTSPLFIQYEAPIGLASTQRKSELTIAPLFYTGGVYRLNDFFVAGFGFYPTALQGGKFKPVDYSDDLTNKELSLTVVRFEAAPSISFQPNKHFAVGASWRIGYMKLQSKAGVFAGPAGAYLDSDLSAWDFEGLKVGAHLQDLNGFSAGVTYRLGVGTKLTGTTTIEDDGLGLLGGAPRAEIPTSLELDIPPQMQVGVAYEWIEDTFLTAFTWEYTWNSYVERLTRVNRTTGTAIASTETQWRDASTLHLGSEYTFKMEDDAKFRVNAGLAFDQVTTRSNLPNPVGPSADHYIGGALGTQYHWGHHIVGLAGNYGSYERSSDSVPADNTVFPGKYSTTSYQLVADYQWQF